MKGKSSKAEFREMAFKKYVECGGNVDMTIRELNKEGFPLSKPTLYEWIEKFDFKGRMSNVDAERQKSTDSQLSFEEGMITALISRKDAYEEYFKTQSGNLDHQAQYAYAGIIKSILDIKERLSSFKASLFLDFMRDMINYLSKNDPEALPLIERNFDDFVAFAKEKYGSK